MNNVLGFFFMVAAIIEAVYGGGAVLSASFIILGKLCFIHDDIEKYIKGN